MKVIKSMNNNTILCLDSKGNQLIAMGKGIGFKRPPYELSDLSKVERTFYELDAYHISLIDCISPDVLLFVTEQIDDIVGKLSYPIKDSAILSLADHISFAIDRAKKGIYIDMPMSYDFEVLYEKEFNISKRVVKKINKRFNVELPPNDAQGIALHFINAKLAAGKITKKVDIEYEKRMSSYVKKTIDIIEIELDTKIKKKTFEYARFAMHIQYLIKRVINNECLESANIEMYEVMKQDFPNISNCVNKISQYFENSLGKSLNREEKLYLLIHINRLYTRS